MSELYVNHEATLPAGYDADVIPMIVVQTSPLLVREATGTRNLAAYNGLPNWVHAPSDPVMVRKSTMTIEATLALRPQSATVTVVAGTLITVSSSGLTWSARAVGTAPTVGQTVALSWGSEGAVVQGVITGAIPVPTGTAPAGLPATSSSFSFSARPIASGSYRSGSLRPDTSGNLFQGHWVAPANSNDNTGVWVHGAAWGGILGKTIDAAKIKVQRGPVDSGVNGPVTVRLRTHNVTSLPSSTPGLGASSNNTLTLSPNEVGEADVTAMVQEIANGTAAGFAVYVAGTTDYAMFLGAGSSDSGVITGTAH